MRVTMDRETSAFARRVLWVVVLAATSSCAVVPQNRRRYIADPTMPAADDPLEKRTLRKLHTSREGSAGGDGKPAGGGCGCGN